MMLPVAELFQRVSLEMSGPVPWLTRIPELLSGVYVIALADPARDFYVERLEEPFRRRWNIGQEIIYIGRATCLSKRLSQFYRHIRGAQSPHRGGQDIKLLPTDLVVCWGVTDKFPQIENRMIEEFRNNVGQLPFGNKVRSAQKRQKLIPA